MEKSLKTRIFSVFSLIIALFLIVSSAFSITAKAEDVAPKSITVFSWEDYIYEEWFDGDKGILEEFEEETGIAVNYVTFATSEEMYNELQKDPTACDILCPSEYMILKMKDENLLQEFDIPETYKKNVSPFIQKQFEDLGLSTKDKTYACGYMWGTMGLIYNAEKYSADDFNKWSNLLTNDDFSGKITIKDSLRDTYIMAVAIVYEDELYALKSCLEQGTKDGNPYAKADYKKDIDEIFNRRDPETIAKVEEKLLELKPRLYSFEVDAGKDDIITGKIDVNFAWSGDASYAISEAEGKKELGYAVPEEGTNIWFDGFVMTKSADVESSIEFLNFMSRPVNAAKNMEYIGYTSVISGEDNFTITYPETDEDDNFIYVDGVLQTYTVDYTGVFDWMNQYFEIDSEDKTDKHAVDLSYFYSGEENTHVVWVESYNDSFYAQFPTVDVIDRAVVMANFSNDDLLNLNNMWSKVKLLTLSVTTIAIILSIIGLTIVAIILYKFKDKIFEKAIPGTERQIRRKNCKVIKIEEIKNH